VYGDNYAGVWPMQKFAEHGILYQVSTKSKTELYLDAIPVFTSGRLGRPGCHGHESDIDVGRCDRAAQPARRIRAPGQQPGGRDVKQGDYPGSIKFD